MSSIIRKGVLCYLSLTPLKTINRFYKSSIALEKLYPNSTNVRSFSPPKQGDRFNGYIPIEELDITYSRSSGPGGQHVNKTASKVDMRFHVKTAEWLSQTLRDKLIQQHPNRINKDGYFVLRSEKTRYQLLNHADCITRLRDILYKLEIPELTVDPITEEKIRKNKEKAERVRLMEKRLRSAVKAARSNLDI